MNVNKLRELAASDKIIAAANKIVAELDERNVSVYVTLAKAALWAVGVLMTIATVVAISQGNWSVLAQASQVLVMLAVSVLGFHEYKGSRVLHILRNWRVSEEK